MDAPRIVLAPRLVPRPLWGRSGARMLEPERWRAVRAVVVDEHGSACAVCGHRQRRFMVCDEDWCYRLVPGTREGAGESGERGEALLAGLRLLCPRCDRVVHLGHTESRHGPDGRDAALRHGADVNGVSVQDMKLLAEVAFEQWARSSSVRRWRVDVDEGLAATFPELCVVAGELVDP